MNDANNAGTLLPCPFCGTYPNPNDPSCATLEQAYARTEVRPFGCPYFTDSDRKMYPLSTPNAPVEQREERRANQVIGEAIKKHTYGSIRGTLTKAIVSELHRNGFSILAVRLDEAAIRKDEREKCAKIAASKFAGTLTSNIGLLIASAIRNGGKQP